MYKDKETARRKCREWYQDHKEYKKAESAKYNKLATIKIRNLLHEYKSERGCSMCDEKDPICLEFHHRNEKKKLFNIGAYSKHRHSWSNILKEIEKCDLVCANCHRKIHRDD